VAQGRRRLTQCGRAEGRVALEDLTGGPVYRSACGFCGVGARPLSPHSNGRPRRTPWFHARFALSASSGNNRGLSCSTPDCWGRADPGL